MKTFEEKWTAWLDGELTGNELAEFEASLPDRTAAEAEKRSAQKLSHFLREQLQPRPMGNEEFFHHQLRQRIEAEEKPALWPIGRLAWAGATFLAIFGLCTIFVLREQAPSDQSQYLTEILNTRVDPTISPDATISKFQTKEDKVTVLWIDGLQSLPAEYATNK
jgi:anti-sigma factor RsiW